MNMHRWMSVSAIVSAWIGCCVTALAADNDSSTVGAPAVTQHEILFRPYAWAPFFKGTSTLGSSSVGIDTNIFEILSKVDQVYGFMGYAEIRQGKASVYSDIVWAKINVGTSVVKSANPIAGLTGTLVASANVWFDMVIAESGAAYEIAKWSGSTNGSLKDGYAFTSSTSLDLIAGARYWYLKPDVELGVSAAISLPALGLSRTTAGVVSASRTIDWVDPLIGLRMRHSAAEGHEFVVRGDVGGFGVGSDITWQANAGYSFDTQILGHTLNNYVGYRVLYIDYKQGSGDRTFGLDLLSHGPVMGVNMKW